MILTIRTTTQAMLASSRASNSRRVFSDFDGGGDESMVAFDLRMEWGAEADAEHMRKAAANQLPPNHK